MHLKARVCRYCHRELLLNEPIENPSGGKPTVICHTSQTYDIVMMAMVFIAFIVIVLASLALFLS